MLDYNWRCYGELTDCENILNLYLSRLKVHSLHLNGRNVGRECTSISHEIRSCYLWNCTFQSPSNRSIVLYLEKQKTRMELILIMMIMITFILVLCFEIKISWLRFFCWYDRVLFFFFLNLFFKFLCNINVWDVK